MHTHIYIPSPDQASNGVVMVAWSSMGPAPPHVDVMVGGTVLASSTTNWVLVDVTSLAPGNYTLTIIGRGAHTVYPLSYTQYDDIADTPFEPSASVTIEVVQSPARSDNITSSPTGFLRTPSLSQPYAYAPSVVTENGAWHAFYCSAGDGSAQDFIRVTTR
jgi:hypothetical protein